MTAIVGITDGETIILGGDSAGGIDDEGYTLDVRKVFARGPYLFGVSGSFRVGQILRFRAELPEPPAATDLEPFLVRELVPAIRSAVAGEGIAGSGPAVLGEKTTLLVGCLGQLWSIGTDLTVLLASPFAAIGSGRRAAYGALHALRAAGVEPARRHLELALEAAAAYTFNVRPPWHFISSAETRLWGPWHEGPPRHLRWGGAAHAILIAAAGGLAGIAVGFGLGGLIRLLVPALPFSTSPAAVVAALAMSAVVGAASGYLPARRAASLDPVDALRAE